jgi:hypothetical protein
MPLGSAPSTFLTAQRLKPVSGARSPILALGAYRFSAKVLVQRRKRPNCRKTFIFKRQAGSDLSHALNSSKDMTFFAQKIVRNVIACDTSGSLEI